MIIGKFGVVVCLVCRWFFSFVIVIGYVFRNIWLLGLMVIVLVFGFFSVMVLLVFGRLILMLGMDVLLVRMKIISIISSMLMKGVMLMFFLCFLMLNFVFWFMMCF